MLVVDDVTVRFGEKAALDGASLQVGAGEVVALLGPSGSGKSTLLRAIAGLETIESGRVLFDGQDLAGVPVHERGFGLMFQSYALFPHLSVADNVAFGLRMKNVADDDVRARVAEVLGWVGLEQFALRRVDRLSGGEQQRVALARTLAPRPRLVMLDEPVGALDRMLRERLVEDIGGLLDREGAAAIYVTHDHEEAKSISDRVAIMRDGKVVQSGPYQCLATAPATPWVAEFLGVKPRT
ncbi:MAG TPA: ABC transporter ATP-binding protein [Acidimicrobiia bacterium]|nr:ABC transporter ATP-binding protein [Acidimicrobiia bacterium]